MMATVFLMCAAVFGCGTYVIVFLRSQEKINAMLADALAAALSVTAVNTSIKLWSNHRQRSAAQRLVWAGKHNGSFESSVERAIKIASDESVIAYADALVSAAEELKESDDRACADYLYPRALSPVRASSYEEFGADSHVMGNPYAKDVDVNKLCQVTTSFYRKILKLPRHDTGDSLRFYMRRHT